MSANVFRPSQLRKLRACEQVAAVCYRMRAGEIEFLLVQTGGGRWTFPKGGAEPGLTHAQAAALEAFEEAGVHGHIEEAAFIRYSSHKRGAPRSAKKGLTVSAHLCEVLRLSTPQEARRNRTWYCPGKAKRRLHEHRTKSESAIFSQVIDRAVARIRHARSTSPSTDRTRSPRSRDGLNQVHMEGPRPNVSMTSLLRQLRAYADVAAVDHLSLPARGRHRLAPSLRLVARVPESTGKTSDHPQ